MGTATLLTLGEVAEHVGRPVRTVQWWAQTDRLPAYRLGGQYVVDAEQLSIAEELAEHRGRRAETKEDSAPVEHEDEVDAEIREVNEWVAQQRALAG